METAVVESTQTPSKQRLLCSVVGGISIANLHHELFPYDQTLKHPAMTNARSYTSIVTHQKLRELSWVVLMQPLYNLNLASSDSLLFLCIANYLAGKESALKKHMIIDCVHFFVNKDKDFCFNYFKITKVIEQKGA